MSRKMKDSGIEWIGEIPEDWKISKIKYIGQYINGYAFKPDDWSSLGKPIIRIQDLTGSSSSPNFYDGILADKYLVKNGDILISWAATLDAFTWQKEDGWLNQHIFKAIPDYENMIKRFFFYLVKVAMENMNHDNKHGIVMQHVTLDIFNKFSVPIPLISEQQRIANFLDKKCAKINSLSSDIQSQISILENYKKSVIFDSLEKGLDGAEVKITNSDVWKTIPKSWELKDIKYVFEIVKRIAGKEGYDILSVTQKGLRVKDISSNEGQIAESYSGYQFVYPTDYVMNHMDLLTGWVDCSTMFGVTSPDYRVFRLQDKKNNNLDYFKYLMQCCYMNRIFYSLGQGVSNLGRWRLQTSTFMNFKIPVPPLEEQNQIAEYLGRKCVEIDGVISEKQKQLEVLEQYKKSLIYEYVTGKKEVIIND